MYTLKKLKYTSNQSTSLECMKAMFWKFKWITMDLSIHKAHGHDDVSIYSDKNLWQITIKTSNSLIS